MPPVDLTGPYRKAAWAEKRRIALQSEIEAILAPGGKVVGPALTREYNPDDGTILVGVGAVPELPWYTGVMIGDVLHNFRSALDHAAWALVKAGAKPDADRRWVAFPIHDDPVGFAARLEEKLPGVSDEARAIIESVQPYGGHEFSPAFAWLRDMSNVDKHQYIHTTIVGTAGFFIQWKPIDCDIVRDEMLFEIPNVPDLVVGTSLFRLHVTNVRSPTPDVELVGTISLYVATEGRTSLMQRLVAIREAVLYVMARLDPGVSELMRQESTSRAIRRGEPPI